MNLGDPGSCSRLGGVLCTTAARLTEASADLDAPRQALVAEVARQVQDAGSRLQAHAQELASLGARAVRLRARVVAAGLDVEDLRVGEPAGVLDGPGTRRHLQEQADRVAARRGRSRAELVRHLRRVGEQLDRTRADAASSGSAEGDRASASVRACTWSTSSSTPPHPTRSTP